MNINLRRATVGDGELLARLNDFVHAPHVDQRPDYFRPTRVDEVTAWFEARLADPDARVYLAELDGAPVGYVLALFHARGASPFSAARRWCEVDQIAVDPARRQRGVARALVEAVARDAALAGVDELKASTWAFNDEARRTFAALGFEVETLRLRRLLPASPFAPVEVIRRPLPAGGFALRQAAPLATPPRAVGDVLARWSVEAPTRSFLAERGPDGAWARLSYADAHRAVRSLAQSLLDLGLGPSRPLLILSGNGVDHALLQLAALHVGVPVAPLSPAYSLLSRDFARLRALAAMVAPGAVYAADGAAFAPALAALDLRVPVLVSRGASGSMTTVDEALRTTPTAAVDEAFARVRPDTVAKILFTSGSTGAPKGVVNTQRMLCSNQQAIAGAWTFLAARPPVVLDWLPWSHTFGGNHNFNLVLWHGGTLYLDGGKAAPGPFEETVRNLREVSPTVYFNVPRGYDLLASRMEADAGLRDCFFRELDVLFYAAAALAPSTWARLEALSRAARGEVVTMTAAWGLTETSPLATQVQSRIDRSGNIGVPARGCEIAFVPDGPKLEMRVKGPNVTPGYWNPGGAVTPLALDANGFFATGDAGRLADDSDPAQGIVFDGRLAENFKLSSGTWVNVGELRVALIAALAPLVADAVITGHGRDEVGALVFPSPDAAAVGDLDKELRARLAAFNATRGGSSSTAVVRIAVLSEPPQIDAGEITDKGYLNQRVLLTRRADDVERLY